MRQEEYATYMSSLARDGVEELFYVSADKPS
jgi:hypothetical protein